MTKTVSQLKRKYFCMKIVCEQALSARKTMLCRVLLKNNEAFGLVIQATTGLLNNVFIQNGFLTLMIRTQQPSLSLFIWFSSSQSGGLRFLLAFNLLQAQLYFKGKFYPWSRVWGELFLGCQGCLKQILCSKRPRPHLRTAHHHTNITSSTGFHRMFGDWESLL